MIEKLKDLEQQLMDELEPEVYEKVKYIKVTYIALNMLIE